MKHAFLILILSAFGPSSWADKIAYIDLQKAVQDTSAGKKAKESLDAEYKKRKDGLDKQKAEIEKKGQELEKKKSVMSEQVLQKKQMELQQEMMAFQKSVNENQVEIQKKQDELLAPIIDKLKKVTEKLVTEKQITVVMEKREQTIFVGAKDADITDDVVKKFETEK